MRLPLFSLSTALMRSMLAGPMRLVFATSVFIAAAISSSMKIASATESVPLSFEQAIHDAGPIVVGSVTSSQTQWGDATKHWMYTTCVVKVEDTLSTTTATQVGSEITISFWGGTIGRESERISDLTMPEVGQRYVFMLRPDWQKPGFTPVIGFEQGMLAVSQNAAGNDVVKSVYDRPLVAGPNGQVARAGDLKASTVTGDVSLSALTTYIKKNAATIKAKSFPPLRGTTDKSDSRNMKTFSKQGVSPELASSALAVASTEPASPPISTSPKTVSKHIQQLTASLADASADALPSSHSQNGRTLDPEYSYIGYCDLPIVVNQLPSSFTPWSPEDQYQMSKWNYYGGEFHVYTNPTGTFAWGNKVFDLDGWVQNADMQSQYGYTWGSTTLAITFSHYDNGSHVDEADIAFNPAYSWTLDDPWVFSGTSTAWPFRATMLHELGHMWGLAHQFNGISIMNYDQQVYRAWAVPSMDDAAAIRALYPGNAVSRNDLGTYLFSSNGYQSYGEASYPSSVVAGNSFTVSNFSLENTGTTTIQSPSLSWYLTQSLNYSDYYAYLGTSTYSPALPPFNNYNPASLSATLTVPTTVPGGSYYLNGYIGDDGGLDFPFDNNHSWSYYQISVYPRLTDAYFSNQTVSRSQSASGYVILGSAAGSNGAYVYLSPQDSNLSVSSPVFVGSGSTYTGFTATAAAVTAPTTSTIQAYSQGITQNASIQITVPTAVTASGATTQMGAMFTVSATLTRTSDNAPLSGSLVYFYFNSNLAGSAYTDSNGYASLTKKILTTGNITLTTAYYASDGYEYSSNTSTIRVNKAPTVLTGTDASGSYGQPVKLLSSLVRTTDNNILNGRTITYSVGSTTLGSVNTSNNVGTLKYKVGNPLNIGKNTVKLSFSGDDGHLPSTGKLTLTITAAGTATVAHDINGTHGKPVTLRATLTRTTDNTGLGTRHLVFKVGSVVVGTASTNPTGDAKITYNIPAGASGTSTITCSYSGEPKYSPSSGNGTLTIH